MGFILEGLESESYDRSYSDAALLKRIVSYFRPHSLRMGLVSLALALNSAAMAAAPVVISRVIDRIAAQPDYRVFLAGALGLAFLGGLAWVFGYINERLVTIVVGEVVLKVREDAFRNTLALDLSFFDEHPSGKIVSRVASDTQDFSATVTLVTDLASQALMVGVLAVWLFSINVGLTLLLFAFAPVAVGIALSFRAIARRVSQYAKRVTARINDQLQESVSGIMVAKTFRQERVLFGSFLEDNRLAYRVGIRRGLVLNSIFPIMSITAGVGEAVLAWSAALTLRAGALTPGDWYLFLQAVAFFWWPLLSIASFWSQFQDGLSAAERVFALIDARPKVVQHPGAVPAADSPAASAPPSANPAADSPAASAPPSANPAADSPAASAPPGTAPGDGQGARPGRPASPRGFSVEFREVTFAYRSGERVLDRFSLAVRPGESLAIVGHTGAGKSSIARLVARFYEFQEGRILIDGQDIRALDLDAYRLRLGYVPQDPYLFTGTVADNIRYGMPGATDEQVRWAASHLGRGDWLEDLPAGLETPVGERGGSISFGQRQLVVLARVLLKDPDLFILDEATASVDPFTEAKIQEGLATVMEGRTAIVIAHRLSTVEHADRIIVLAKGRILEEGTHAELLARGGDYAELYNTYFRHQSLEYIEESREA